MADSNYIIDIAANMPAGVQTIEELDALTASLTGAGRRSDDFQVAIRKASASLDAAKQAADLANNALAEGSVQYRLLERDALRASKALERANLKGRFDPRLARDAAEANDALEQYAGTLAHLETEAARAGGEQKKFGQQLANVNRIAAHVDKGNQEAIQKAGKLAAAISQLPGPFGRLGGHLARTSQAQENLASAFGDGAAKTYILAAGAALATIALAALTIAAIAAYVAFGKYAITQADAARSAVLARDAFAAISPETKAAAAAFDKIEESTGATDVSLRALTKQLREAKVSASQIPVALKAAALAEAALGTGGASEFIDRIKAGTLSVKEFGIEAQSKFGGIVAKLLRGLSAQGARFQKLWGDLFADLNLEPVLDGFAVLVGMFDRANPLAQAFGFAINGAFSPIPEFALSAAEAIEAFALGAAIQFTRMYLAAKPTIKALEAIAGVDGSNLTSWLATAGVTGKVFAVAMVGMAITAGILVAAFAVVAVAVAVVTTAVFALLTGIAYVGFQIGLAARTIFDFFSGIGTAVGEWISTIVPQVFQMGVDLVMGLVRGIASVAGAIVSAISNAVTGAIDKAKELLGIHSPSKVFAEIGVNTVAGFTGAIDAGAGEAQGSMASLIGNDPGGASTPAPQRAESSTTSSGKASGKTIDLSGATFNFSGVADAETAKDRFAELLTSLLENDVVTLTGAH